MFYSKNVDHVHRRSRKSTHCQRHSQKPNVENCIFIESNSEQTDDHQSNCTNEMNGKQEVTVNVYLSNEIINNSLSQG